MVISSTGLVLTNNHVIDQSTSVSATLVTSGRTYTAKVIGYNATDDVALLQLVGASGLKTVSLSNSDQAKVGEAVLALGNAGGAGGLPSTAQGTIQGVNKSIKASDQGANTTEDLHGMLETDAPIQEGDSGGPLVNASGEVVGMDTAANSSEGAGGNNTTATQGFAIPINTAISIADQINQGKASTTVHIGLSGFLGVNVANANAPSNCGTGAGGTRRLRPRRQIGRAGLRRLPGGACCDGRPGRRRRDHLGQRQLGEHRERPDQPDDRRPPGQPALDRLRQPVRRQAHHHRHPDRVGQVRARSHRPRMAFPSYPPATEAPYAFPASW